jgi:hypothetical protein
MAKATKKSSAKGGTGKTAAKKGAKKTVTKKAAAKKGGAKKNKLGVKNSLVNNINAKKKKGTSKPASKSSVSKESYKDMQNNWGED